MLKRLWAWVCYELNGGSWIDDPGRQASITVMLGRDAVEEGVYAERHG